jgi:hypothetical protein
MRARAWSLLLALTAQPACLPASSTACDAQGDLLLYEAQGDAQLESMTVLQAVLASDSEPARAVQVRSQLDACMLHVLHVLLLLRPCLMLAMCAVSSWWCQKPTLSA